MNMPLISVLIPTYNVQAFVEDAVRSIMTQTYSNLEILVVDDCSTDNTYAIVEKLAGEDDRIKLHRNPQNKRIVDTLNYALSIASGEYIARMDGDDISLPERLERQYQFLNSHPDVHLVGLNYIIIDEQAQEIKKERHLNHFSDIVDASKYVSPVPHFWLTRKKIYDEVGPYRIPTAEDYDFILRLIDKGLRVSNLPEYLYLYRIRGGNTMTAAGLHQKKSFRYVQFLQKERQSRADHSDSFSSSRLDSKLRTSRLQSASYGIASRLHQKFVNEQSRRKYLSLGYLALALMFSPNHLLGEKLNRLRYRRILKKSASNMVKIGTNGVEAVETKAL